jgi:hypothetical protein
MGAVLCAAIRVVNTAWWRAAQGNSHVQRPDRQILFHPVGSIAQPITRLENRS